MPPIPSTIPAARGLKSFLRQEPGALESGMMIMIHGKPKAGKTTLAATASQFFRPEGDARLSDMLFLVADMDGLGALDSQGLVPWSINLLELWNAHGFRKGNSLLRQQLKALLVEHPEIRIISVSSLTSFDVECNAEFYDEVAAEVDVANLAAADSKQRSFDSYAAFRDVLGEHRMLISSLARSGCDIIYETHSVLQSVAVDRENKKTDGQKRKESLAMVGGGSITPDLTGKAQAIYNRHVSLQIALLAKTVPGNKAPTRTVHTIEAADMQAGSRYEKFLDPVEPFDLRAILGKIRAAKAKSPAGAEGDTK